jgi:hypothetical protein
LLQAGLALGAANRYSPGDTATTVCGAALGLALNGAALAWFASHRQAFD